MLFWFIPDIIALLICRCREAKHRELRISAVERINRTLLAEKSVYLEHDPFDTHNTRILNEVDVSVLFCITRKPDSEISTINA